MEIRRGTLSAVFDRDGAFLRKITVGEEELFRGIGFVVRDANWGTPELFAELRSETAGTSLRVTSGGKLEMRGGDLSWRVGWTIRETLIEAEAEWASQQGFATNRTGFVVLHSLGACRGRPLRVTHPDGSEEDAEFPTLVSPHQPCFDISEMAYRTTAGTGLRLAFAGETFEIEDQRNWTDASFKTYCRPLRLPFPYRIEPGDRSHQSVRIAIEPRAGRSPSRTGSAPEIGPALLAPLMGTTLPPAPATAEDREALRQLDLPLLALELDVDGSAVDADFDAALDAKLALPSRALRLDFRPAERRRLLAVLRRLKPRLEHRMVLGVTLWGADDELISAAQSALPGVAIGAGSPSFFAELNRTHPLPSLARYLAFASSPTVHGISDDTIGETTEPLEDLVATYATRAGAVDLHVGPLTLGVRFDAVATPEGRRGAPPDPRQGSAVAAAWSLGSFIGLLSPRTRALTLFEPFGPRGLLAAPGVLTPAARVLLSLASLAGAEVRPVRWPNSPRARGLLQEAGGATLLWIANAEAGSARLPLPPGPWRVEAAEADGTVSTVESGHLVVDGFSAVRLEKA